MFHGKKPVPNDTIEVVPNESKTDFETAKEVQKGQKWTTLSDITKFIDACNSNITIVRVESDVEGNTNNTNGP